MADTPRLVKDALALTTWMGTGLTANTKYIYYVKAYATATKLVSSNSA